MHIKRVFNGSSAFKMSCTFMKRIRTFTKTHNLRYSSGKILGLWVSTFNTMLAEVIRIGVLVSATVAALPNWPDSYGDVKIPYPFGIIEGCYLKDTAGRDFSINCDTLSGKTQPKTRNVVVTNISIQGEIDIMTYNGFDCYDQSGKPLASNKPTTL